MKNGACSWVGPPCNEVAMQSCRVRLEVRDNSCDLPTQEPERRFVTGLARPPAPSRLETGAPSRFRGPHRERSFVDSLPCMGRGNEGEGWFVSRGWSEKQKPWVVITPHPDPPFRGEMPRAAKARDLFP